MALGDSLLEKCDFGGAIAAYNKAIGFDPNCAKAYCERGRAYASKDDFDRAFADWSTAARLDPNYAYPHACLGAAYARRHDRQKALLEFSKAIQLDSGNPDEYFARGIAYAYNGEYDPAIADLSEAVRLRPACADFHARLGAIYGRKGDFGRSIAECSKAIQLDPDYSYSYVVRGAARLKNGECDLALADLNEAVRLDPEDGSAYSNRGAARANKGDYGAAIADLDAAIRLDATSPWLYEVRGVIWIKNGQYERGITDFQTMIQLNPKDTAAAFEAWPKEKLSANALQFGERQVRQMLADRPVMAQYGDKAAALYQWAARKFAGEDLGNKIFWKGSDPVRVWNAESGPTAQPTDVARLSVQSSQCRFIRVRRKYNNGTEEGKDRPFEEVWRDAVFELYNNSSARDFDRVFAEAVGGELSRHEYARAMLEVEGSAAEKTRAFYIHVFLPWANKHHLSTRPEQWCVALRSDPSENLLLSAIGADDPHWRYYESDRDELVLAGYVQKKEHKKAEGLLAEMLRRARTNQEKAAAYSLQGWLYSKLDNPNRAVAALAKAVELCPKDAALHCRLGSMHAENGERDKAIADFDEAIRLNPDDADAHICRGYEYAENHQYDKATADFAAAIRINPTSAKGYFWRAGVYVWKGDYDKAIVDSSKAIKLEPKFNSYGTRAAAYANKGAYDKAVIDYNEAIQLAPNDAQLHVYRGKVFLANGDFDKALADANAAIKLDPKNDDARRLRDSINQWIARTINAAEPLPQQPATAPSQSYDFDAAVNGTLKFK
jgi:tetratricopeptide (TPR) repeat protein